ncbi:hypothetical protein DFA_11794 [Cavenderia fasciculata]|uniref:CCAAT-binding factor domain-containing protein n=1 Tax=Cavenderia fasciculata TaxID=261658 RepID=F4QE84_CACFS|nr:uncharacterized protein DFA_11794 [Cavenderia fasciculata]EGG14031.1 hypothetical protein DFA_11794 [Cavenderia fasciculata]|eukprot:XP_004350739.1 hypothetical protein DFA_11794 [Cavenderia fasciculata]
MTTVIKKTAAAATKTTAVVKQPAAVVQQQQQKKRKQQGDVVEEEVVVTKKTIKLDPVEHIKQLEQQVLEKVENTNKILDIIAICNNEENKENLEIIFQTIKSLERIFRNRLDVNNKVLCQEFIKYRKSASSIKEKSKDGLVVYARWLINIYNNYLELLSSLLRHQDRSIQLPTLTSLFHMLVLESSILELSITNQDQSTNTTTTTTNKSNSSSSTSSTTTTTTTTTILAEIKDNVYYQLSGEFLRNQILEPMLINSNLDNHLLDHFKSRFLPYHDVLYHMMTQLSSLCDRMVREKKTSQQLQHCTMDRFVENVFDLLVLFEVIEETPEEWKILVGEPMSHMVSDLKAMKKKNKKNQALQYPETPAFKISITYWITITSRASYKSSFAKAWMSFLALPLPSSIYKHVLLGLPDQVIPHLSDPRSLMDFFSKSYHLGGVSSILALNGLFILIHKYNLEYPEFFKKLYSLFQPGLIYAKYRARFFKLAELFLSSTYLPNYIVAAFVKRCSYLCLLSPANGCMTLLPFIYNLLQRHPECHILVNNVIQKREDPTTSTISGLLLNSAINAAKSTKQVKGFYGKDSYLIDEEDPSKCQALKSSLWEIQLLRDHYHPDISKLAKLFDNGLSNALSTEDFSNSSYKSLFDSSIKKKVPKVPLAYQPVKQLINDSDGFNLWKF